MLRRLENTDVNKDVNWNLEKLFCNVTNFDLSEIPMKSLREKKLGYRVLVQNLVDHHLTLNGVF